jgi:hypothetical protein
LAICGSLFAVQEKQAPRQSEYTCMVEKRPVFCWIFGCQMPEEGRGKREEGRGMLVFLPCFPAKINIHPHQLFRCPRVYFWRKPFGLKIEKRVEK